MVVVVVVVYLLFGFSFLHLFSMFRLSELD